MNDTPNFTQDPACAGAVNPDIWFPEQTGTKTTGWSRIPSAMYAREICNTCPAYKECEDYSLQFFDLDGIWAGKDVYERSAIRRKRGILSRSIRETIPNIAELRLSQREIYEA